MKTFILFIALSFVFITTQFFSCRKETNETYSIIQLNTCTNTVVNGNNLQICFDALVQDARCPINANCVWQGAATVKLSLTANHQTHSFNLSTVDLLPQYRTDTTVFGYRVQLRKVTPYPGDGITAPYRAEVSISQ